MEDAMDHDDRLLDYLQGHLDPKARASFEAELAANPRLSAELEVLRAAGAALGQVPVPIDAVRQGWDRLAATIAADRVPSAANLNRWPGILRAIGFAVVAVGLWQVLIVPRLQGDDQGFRPASQTIDAPALHVVFAETAALADVTALLRQIGATVVDGPGALGLFTLRFSDATSVTAAQTMLAARPDLVVSVTLP